MCLKSNNSNAPEPSIGHLPRPPLMQEQADQIFQDIFAQSELQEVTNLPDNPISQPLLNEDSDDSVRDPDFNVADYTDDGKTLLSC